MDLIVDTCMASQLFSVNREFDALEKALRGKKAVAIHNPSLLAEYSKKFIVFLATLSAAGRSKSIPDGEVSIEIKKMMESEDYHIISLAISSGCRVLCSVDKPLHVDFKNKKILDPKGKVYSGMGSKSVLAPFN